MPYTANKDRYQKMEYSHCGKSGLKLPRVSLGLWHNFGSNDSMDTMREMLRTAFDCGITHFDMANNYGPVPGSAEENFGTLFQKDWKVYRDELVLSSKAGYFMWEGPYGDGGSRKYLMASIDQSLRRTGVNYFDIFYSHRMDTETPLEETMGALSDIVKQGKALYAGISNYDGATTAKAAQMLEKMGCPFIINQSRYSMLDRQIETNGLLSYAKENGLGIMAFSPLAQGLLSGRYLDGIPKNSRIEKGISVRMTKETLTPETLHMLHRLNTIAQNRGQTLAQMALAWVLQNKAVTSVLIGASSAQQILENAETVKNSTFTQQELQDIETAIQ